MKKLFTILLCLALIGLVSPVSAAICTKCGGGGNVTATIAVNYTFTGAPGTSALVTNIGNTTVAKLDFTIPSGINGTDGAPGPQGPIGLPNMTAGPEGAMNQTANMTPGPVGASGATGGTVLYFNHSAMPDVAGYEGLASVPAGNAEADESKTVSSALGQVLIGPYVTFAGQPGLSSYAAGLWRFRTYHYVDNEGGVTTVVFKVYNRTQTGTETLLFTATSDEINDLTASEYLTSYVQTQDYIVLPTDRVVVKVYGQTTSVSNKIIHFVYDGTSRTSHIQTPLSVSEATTLTFTVKAGEPLKKGQAVYLSGASGEYPVVSLANNTDIAKTRVIGLMTSDLSTGSVGLVRRGGAITAIDSRVTNAYVNPNGETWVAGDLLFAIESGGMSKSRPISGRSVKAAYSLLGSNAQDVLLVYPMENSVWITAASDEGVVLRLGDDTGTTNVSIRNYANTPVAGINSLGNASFAGADMQSLNITHVMNPVGLQDAATKWYVDNKTSGSSSNQKCGAGYWAS